MTHYIPSHLPPLAHATQSQEYNETWMAWEADKPVDDMAEALANFLTNTAGWDVDISDWMEEGQEEGHQEEGQFQHEPGAWMPHE